MAIRYRTVKAPRLGAFLLSGLLMSVSAAYADCPPSRHSDKPVSVRYVQDGDTVILSDQRRVRLIGINTPELGHRGQPNQPLAVRARDRLRQLLFNSDNRARLRPGPEDHDRHGRSLAHLYLPDGRLLSEQLVREGLGWMVAVGANVNAADCLKTAEKQAKQAHLGVWSITDYQAKDSARLKLKTRGFQRIKGRIIQVIDRPAARWLKLQGRFAIRIPREALARFPSAPTAAWTGRLVAVRGWLYASRGELRVNLQHPAALDILETATAENSQTDHD